MSEIKHIVFDIGKVLVHYDPEIPFRKLIPDADQRAHFFENICTHDWNLEQDRGRTWREAEDILIAEHPDHEPLIRSFRTNWIHMVPHAYEDSVAIMTGLIEDGADVTMLTNFSHETFPEACEKFPFLNLPRGVTVSGAEKMIKPDPAIYDLHTKRFELNPSATLFIDDSTHNVAGALDYGWQAVHFTNAKALEADLKRLGIGK